MPDSIALMNQIDCGQHCDLACFANNPGHVKWLYALRNQISDGQIEKLLEAICCAPDCGLSTPADPHGVRGLEAWWWWK